MRKKFHHNNIRYPFFVLVCVSCVEMKFVFLFCTLFCLILKYVTIINTRDQFLFIYFYPFLSYVRLVSPFPCLIIFLFRLLAIKLVKVLFFLSVLFLISLFLFLFVPSYNMVLSFFFYPHFCCFFYIFFFSV